MKAIELALDFVMQQEGGYVNDAVDLGGATKHGISFRFLMGLAPELADIDGDGDVDAEDIAALTPEKALEIYRSEFWEKMKLDRFSYRISIALMDSAVNMGRRTAGKILQQAVNSILANEDQIPIDGQIGPLTMTAVNYCGDQDNLVGQLLLHRIWRYHEITSANRKLTRFLLGWIGRVKKLEEYLR